MVPVPSLIINDVIMTSVLLLEIIKNPASLIGCESLPFFRVLSKARCRYKAQVWQGQNIFRKTDI